MRKAFDHIGLWTDQSQPGEFWVEFSQVWVTNPRAHPFRLEFLRAKSKPDVPKEQTALWQLWNGPHIAYRVDNLQEAIHGEVLIFGPFNPGGFGQVAFIWKEGVVVEYMEYTDESHWFGQPNPLEWKPAEFWRY